MFVGDKANLDQTDKLAPAFDKPKITKNAKQKSVKIECRCKGKQEPKITWKKAKVELKDTPNRYKLSKTKEADDTYLFSLEILVSRKRRRAIRSKIILFLCRMQMRMIVEFIRFSRRMTPVKVKH